MKVAIVSALLAAIILPIGSTIFIYEKIFGQRSNGPEESLSLNVNDFIGLKREPLEFTSDKGQLLRGFIYKSALADGDPHGLIILSHGLGGGHVEYLEVLNYFVERGFWAMGFDNTGTYRSEGKGLLGLPQAVFDLERALNFVESDEYLSTLPRLIYGHSMGGYASCAVLNNDVAIDGVVSMAGFNRTQDIMLEAGKEMFGSFVGILSPHIALYERTKFGQGAKLTAAEGIAKSEAAVMIVHGDSDDVISLDSSIYKHFATDIQSRVKTKLVLEGTHDLMFSAGAFDYKFSKYRELLELAENYGGKANIPPVELERFNESVEREKLHPRLEVELLDEVIAFFMAAIAACGN